MPQPVGQGRFFQIRSFLLPSSQKLHTARLPGNRPNRGASRCNIQYDTIEVADGLRLCVLRLTLSAAADGDRMPNALCECQMQVQMNNLNPKFAKSFDIVWQFEIRQDIEIYVYDWDTGDVRTCDVNKQVQHSFARAF
jgi:hypothetical protein